MWKWEKDERRPVLCVKYEIRFNIRNPFRHCAGNPAQPAVAAPRAAAVTPGSAGGPRRSVGRAHRRQSAAVLTHDIPTSVSFAADACWLYLPLSCLIFGWFISFDQKPNPTQPDTTPTPTRSKLLETEPTAKEETDTEIDFIGSRHSLPFSFFFFSFE